MVERRCAELLLQRAGRAAPARSPASATRDGAPLLSALGELRPSRLMRVVRRLAGAAFPNPTLDRRASCASTSRCPSCCANAADSVKRLPYFCAGCPHNTSHRGCPRARARAAGIGCHFMASWMERDTAGLIQMGGEGVDWVCALALHDRCRMCSRTWATAPTTTRATSRSARPSPPRPRITYKILYNDAVAMTGGQPVDGADQRRRDRAPGRERGRAAQSWWCSRRHRQVRRRSAVEFPRRHRPSTTAASSTPCSAGCARCAGVTVLIYEQTCAAEKRRRRKKGELADPAAPHLHQRGASARAAATAACRATAWRCCRVETDWGRKRRIDQSACNKDYSCVEGLLPELRQRRPARRAAQARRRPGATRRGALRARGGRRCPTAAEPVRWTGPTTCWSPASAAPAS